MFQRALRTETLYSVEGEWHLLKLSKDQLITLVALVHEGLENIEQKSNSGNELAKVKLEDSRAFVSKLNGEILSA